MPTRTQTTQRPSAGRFSRPSGPPARRPSGRRPTATSRRPTISVPRRPQKKSGMARLTGGMAGLLPGAAAKKKSGGGGGKGRTAGLAMLAGLAGLALKNRGKLQGMARGKASGTGDRGAPAHAEASVNPVVVAESGGGPPAT